MTLREVIELSELIKNIILGLSVPAILFIAQQMYKLFKKTNAESKATTDGIKALLRHEIKSIYDEAYEQGFITAFNSKMVEDTYTSYKMLKGNSYIDQLMCKIREFDIKD